MFEVANIRFRGKQQQKQSLPASQATLTVHHQRQQQHTSTLVITQGMTTMDPPPSIINIDQNLLHELTKRFPEVPSDVIIQLIQQNGNHREQCMMALARESQFYPPLPSGSDPTVMSNGLRNRSDSAGSRGSISSVGTGQSPKSHQQFSVHTVPSSVPYHHSSSEPYLAQSNDSFVNHGPKTAPSQPDNFNPFPNTHQGSIDYAEAGHQYNRQWGISSGSSGYSSNVHGTKPWRPGHDASTHQPTGQYTHYGNTVISRPEQFEQNFPAPTWERTFSPGSPSKKPNSQGGTPTHQHNTHVPTTQSPVTTPPRHPHPWDTTPTSPTTMFRPPNFPRTGESAQRPDHSAGYAGSRPDKSASTYISSYSKFIRPTATENYNPSSINIDIGTSGQPFSLTSVSTGPRQSSSNVPAGQSFFHLPSSVSYGGPNDSWIMENRAVVHNPPNLLTNTDSYMGIKTQPSGSQLPAVSSSGNIRPTEFATMDLQRTPSSEGRQIRSGSLGGEDTAYTQSLLRHQHDRLEKLKLDIRALLEHREVLKQQVAHKDQCVLQAQRNRLGNRPSINASDLQKVREENRALQVESHLLTLEFDRITKGQAVIGRDPNEDFYARIPPGQVPVPGSTSSGTSTPTSSTTSTSHHPSSHPPAPPNLVSGREHARDLHNVTESEEEHWSCSACTFDNHPELSQCEMCNMPRVRRR